MIHLCILRIIRFSCRSAVSRGGHIRILPVAPAHKLVCSHGNIILTSGHPDFGLAVAHRHTISIGRRLSRIVDLLRLPTRSHTSFSGTVGRKQRPFIPIALFCRLDRRRVTILTIGRFHLPKVSIRPRFIQRCPVNTRFTRSVNCIKHVGRGRSGILSNIRCHNARSVNGANVRGFCRSRLRNRINCRRIRAGTRNHMLQILGRASPVPNGGVILDLSIGLRRTTRSTLNSHHNSIITLSPTANRILTVIDGPDFSPGDFIANVDFGRCTTLRSSVSQPLFGHILHNLCTPNSAVGPRITVTNLSTNMIAPRAHIFSPNCCRLPSFSRGCHG